MNTVTLNFRATGQQLVRTGSEKFAANTVNYIRAVFDLGDGWDGFDSVRAVWATDFAKIATVLDSDGACAVPWEVLKRVDTVMVNLVGSIADGDVLTDRLTTYKVKALDVNGCTNIAGTETAEITPSQFEQFVEAVANEVAKIKDISDVRLNDDYTLTFIFSDGTEWTTPIPIRGEQGETGNGIASAVLNADYTLTLNFTDGTHYTTPPIRGAQGVQGETGNGIDRIELTDTTGAVKTYTIYFTDGSTYDFEVTDGEVTLAELASVLPTDTASGAIASFTDGSDLFDYLSCIVDIDPVQDLHGYDKPWAGGAGKNKFDESTLFHVSFIYNIDELTPNEKYRSAIIDNLPAGTYTFSTTLTNCYIVRVWYDGAEHGVSSITQSTTFTTTTTGKVGVCFRNYSTTEITETFHTQIQTGSTPTTWQPYSNICPIYGHDSVGANVAGVNVWDEEVESGYINVDNGTNAPDNSRYRCKNYISVLPNTEYYFKAPNHAVANNVVHRLYYYDANKNFISSPSGIYSSHGFTTPANAYFVRFFVNEALSNFDNTLSINYPSTDHDYHAYEGDTYTADLPQTVYGGWVDLVTGEGEINELGVDLGSLSGGKSGSTSGGFTMYLPSVYNQSTNIRMIASSYVYDGYGNSAKGYYGDSGTFRSYYNGSGTSNEIYVRNENYADATFAEFKAAMSGQMIVYPLATPIPFNIDPQVISTLRGRNNVWSEQGDVDVTYKADIQLYIEKKTNELAVAIAAL